MNDKNRYIDDHAVAYSNCVRKEPARRKMQRMQQPILGLHVVKAKGLVAGPRYSLKFDACKQFGLGSFSHGEVVDRR